MVRIPFNCGKGHSLCLGGRHGGGQGGKGEAPKGQGQKADLAARVAAEDMPAIEALAVAEVMLVNDIAQLAASDGSCRGTDQAAQQSTGQAADSDTDGTGDSAEGCTDLGTGQGAGRSGGSSGDTADGACGLAADTARDYLGGMAEGTNMHEELLAMDAKKPGAR